MTQPWQTPLTDRSSVVVAGPDAASFLQNLLTCDVRKVTPAAGSFGALCVVNGRVVAFFSLLVHEGAFVLSLPADLAAPVRDRLARVMDERAVADAYIDPVATRVQHFAGGLKGEADDDILKVIAEGHKSGSEAEISDLLESLPDHVKALTAEGVRPDQAVGTFLDERRAGWYDDAVDFMFSHLMGKPTAYLSRSPTFTQAYWKHWEQIAGGLSPDDAKILLANARKAKLSNAQIRRLSQTAAAGEHAGKIALKDGDLLAKGFALDETKKLLYDAAERNQFFDSMRIAFPFGDAWKEVITRWATLTRENPRIPRRFQQLIQGARGAGIFSKDPQDGREYFIVPGSEQITKRISGMPFPMRASVDIPC